jgi:flagellar biosynthesis/type III secretory pathway M-ring protein FliF/YscJ
MSIRSNRTSLRQMRLFLARTGDTLITWGPVLSWVLLAIVIVVIVALVMSRRRESRRHSA